MASPTGKTNDATNNKGRPADSLSCDGSAQISLLALLQAVFYIVTGIWPLLSIHTFEKVTGPKTDRWLVKTVASLITIIGLVLAMAGTRRKVSKEIGVLAVGSALGLTAIDFVYVAKKRIAKIYLLDAMAEIILAASWIILWFRARRSSSS